MHLFSIALFELASINEKSCDKSRLFRDLLIFFIFLFVFLLLLLLLFYINISTLMQIVYMSVMFYSLCCFSIVMFLLCYTLCIALPMLTNKAQYAES